MIYQYMYSFLLLAETQQNINKNYSLFIKIIIFNVIFNIIQQCNNLAN